jgi:hypothetical protein
MARMPCPPRAFRPVEIRGRIVGLRCGNCSDVFDALPVVSADGQHTHWFAVTRSPAVAANMNAADVETNLVNYADADPRPPLHNGVLYVDVDL